MGDFKAPIFGLAPGDAAAQDIDQMDDLFFEDFFGDNDASQDSEQPSTTSGTVAGVSASAPAPSPAPATRSGRSQRAASQRAAARAKSAASSSNDGDTDGGDISGEETGGTKKKAKTEGGKRRALQPNERLARSRERNRIHAKKSRLRKKFFVDSLKANLQELETENEALRKFISDKLGMSYDEYIAQNEGGTASSGIAKTEPNTSRTKSSARDGSLIASRSTQPTIQIEAPDFRLVQALQVSQQNFVVSDPNLPDNPIVFASQGFYRLTGYTPPEVIGRNCRFLQGPATDPEAVAMIRRGVEKGVDTAVCLVNYKKDSTPFWNQFFVAPLRGIDGNVVNFVGVQCEVDATMAQTILSAQKSRSSLTRGGKPQAASGRHSQPVSPFGQPSPGDMRPAVPTSHPAAHHSGHDSTYMPHSTAYPSGQPPSSMPGQAMYHGGNSGASVSVSGPGGGMSMAPQVGMPMAPQVGMPVPLPMSMPAHLPGSSSAGLPGSSPQMYSGMAQQPFPGAGFMYPSMDSNSFTDTDLSESGGYGR